MLIPVALHAQTWTGGGGDDLWGTGANWGGTAPTPGTGTDLTFAGTTRLTPNNNYTAWDDFRHVFFAAGSGSFNITGNAVDIFGKIENNSANLQTFGLEFSFNSANSEINPVDGDLLINGANIFNNGNNINIWGNNGKTVTLDTVIQGTGGLLLQQNSIAILAKNNTYSGATVINAGTLQIGNGGADGNFGSGSMTVGSSGTLVFNRTGSFNLGAITTSSGAQVRVAQGTVVATAATSLGSLATGNVVQVTSGGAINLNGVNRSANRMNVSIAGSGVGGTGALLNTVADTFSNAGVLNLTLTGNATIGGTNRFDIGRVGTDAGTISGNGFTLTKVGANSISMRGDASGSAINIVANAGRIWAEDTNLAFGGTSGTLTINNGGRAGTWGNRTIATPVTINTGGILYNEGGGTGTWSGTISAATGSTIDASGGDMITSGTVTASGNLIKTGGSQWAMTGTTTISGNLDVQAGVVQVGNVGTAGSIGNPGSITLTRNDIALRYRLSGADATLSSAVTFVATGSQLRQHAGNAADKLTLTGAVGSNPANGVIGVAGGNLVLASGSTTQVRQFSVGSENAGQTATLTIENGANVTTRYMEVGNQTNRLGTVNQTGGTVTIQSGDTGFRLGHWAGANRIYNLSGGELDATALSANSGEARWVNVGWDGQGLMTVGGAAGSATLRAAGVRLDRNRTGVGSSASTLTISANGVVEIGSLGAEGQGTDDFIILNGGTARGTATSTWGTRVDSLAASTIDVGTGFTVTQSGVLSGAATITKTGAGILALSNTGNTFTGKYNVTGGSLAVGADTHFGAVPGAVTADYVTLTGGTLRLTAGMTVNANRGITIGSGATIHTNTVGTSNNAIIASIIAGSGGLTLAANGDTSATGGGVGGSLQLSGANTFTGNVRITSGLVDANANFGNASNIIILDGGGLVDKNLNIAVTRNIQVGAAGGVLRTYGTVNNNIYSGSISNESGVLTTTLRHTDTGLLKLGGNGSGFTGTFDNQRGSLQITANNANWANTDFLQDTNGGTITFNGGGNASIRSLTSTRDVFVQNAMTLRVGAGGITMTTNGHWWQTSSGTVGNLTSSTGTLTVTNGAPTGNLTTLDQQIRLRITNDGANPVALVKNNNNSLALNQTNTYTGGTTINGGRINADNLAAFGTGAVTVNNGGQAFLTQSGSYANNFTIAGNGTVEAAGALGAIRFSSNTIGGNVTVAASGARVVGYLGSNGTIAGNLLGTGNLEINIAGNASANGIISLTGSGSGHTGTVNVSGGRFNMGSALGGSVVVADGATLGDEGTIAGNLTLGATTGASLAVNPASSGRISASGNLVLNGVTNLVFTQPFGAPGAIAIASYGGTLTDGNGGTLSDSFSVPDAANYRTVTFTDNAGVIELDLGRQNIVWTGATNSTWEAQGTGTNWTSTDNLFYNLDAITFDDSATNKTVTVSGTVTPNSTIFDNSAGNDYTVSGGTIAGVGGLTKTNTGNVTFTTTNTFTGAVNIQGGSVTVGNGGTTGTLGGTGDITVAAGASLNFNRSDTVNLGRRAVGTGTLVQNGTGTLRTGQAGNNVNITVNSGTFEALEGGWATTYFATTNREITINGGSFVTSVHTLGGLGGGFNRPNMTINTGGTWQLNGEQYMDAGDITLNGGTILVTANDLRLQSGTMTVQATSGGSTISRTGSGATTLFDTVTFNVANGSAAADLTVSTPINQSGTRGITKQGAGTMVISGAASYTGTTTVAAGVLAIASTGSLSTSSTITVSGGELNFNSSSNAGNVNLTASGATLSGSGTGRLGNVAFTLSSGTATLAAGNSIGTLNTGSLALNGNTISVFEIAKNGMTLSSDLVSGSGADALTFGGLLQVVFDTTHVDALSVGDTFTLFSGYDFSSAGSFASLDLVDPGSGYIWDTSNLSVNGSITVAIPEPGPVLLAFTALIPLFRRRR